MTASNVMVSSIVDPNQNRNKVLPNLNRISGDDDEKKVNADKQKSYLHQKYKKEKKFRKISQRLIDELQPVQIDAGKGESWLASSVLSVARLIVIILFIFDLDEFGMVRNAEEQYLRDIGYKRHAFNILVSSKIGQIRDIPDTRNKL